ncbi:uncharacterized protein LTR77_010133 [Saxophila tyrrhenica]|uniref:Uncharacterized protein n=1 Tax=Saxophila tyrrhenica TaxID=1690608 RepID=A0AAV9NZD2_9PEZI|nr:hypothetical protein LTR77_010133 [Saxophila tyrrhenica]
MRPPSPSKCTALFACFLLTGTLLHRLGRAIHYNVFPHPRPTLGPNAALEVDNNRTTTTSIDLVLATTARDDTSWTSNLHIPNLNVVRYIANDASARHRPPRPKGNEALMYLTYLYDFYHHLPDIVIFTHAEELPWHVEGTLLRNVSFALSQLDLQQYFNLRVTWRAGCPTWIDTTKGPNDWDKEEEPFMREAWTANFGGEEAPDLLGGPCCSQFAITRAAVQRQSREQYKQNMEWILRSQWPDRVIGRVWEHMWPRLFTGEPSDCGYKEKESLCQMYKICFAGDRELREYKELWEERERLKEQMSFFRAIWAPGRAKEARGRMLVVKTEIEEGLKIALSNGMAA